MALRAIGKRNPALHTQALTTAARVVESDDVTATWIGRDVQREIESRR